MIGTVLKTHDHAWYGLTLNMHIRGHKGFTGMKLPVA